MKASFYANPLVCKSLVWQDYMFSQTFYSNLPIFYSDILYLWDPSHFSTRTDTDVGVSTVGGAGQAGEWGGEEGGGGREGGRGGESSPKELCC